MTCFLADSFCHYHQAAVGQGVLAGGQGDELVAVPGLQPGIVESVLAAVAPKFIQIRIILGVHKHMVRKPLAGGGGGFEHANDLISMAATEVMLPL